MTVPPRLAIVEKAAADETIAALKEEGCYDHARSVREYDDHTLGIPVTKSPDTTDVQGIVDDTAPDYRLRDLEDRLRARGFSAAEREAAPSSWAVIGTVILSRFDECTQEGDVGEALLELHRGADTVLAIEGVSGEHREPDVRVVAGAGDTETIHYEHGTAYAMDLAEVMFSPGNKAERVRMGDVVAEAERVFDMFAGIGYFTLPMARAGADVTAVERNPTAFRYLLENAALNNVTEKLEAFRADCRDVETRADRIVMGYFDAREYLEAAVAALREGGAIHVHDIAPSATPFAQVEASLAEQEREFAVTDRRIVKSHSPGMDHVVVDAGEVGE